MAISVQDLVAPGKPAAPAPAPTAAPAAPAATPPPVTTNDPAAAPSDAPQPGRLQEPLVPKDEAKAQIPDAVLQLPTFRALLEGAPPALSTKGAEQDPDLEVIKANAEPLLYSGFGFYQAKDGVTHVIYNSQFIDGNALKIADEKGKLDTIVAPYSELKSFFTQGLAEPDSAPEGATAAPAPAPAAPAQPLTPPAAPAAQSKLQGARLASVAPGQPSTGPAPGQGRVLNQILKPAV